MCKVTDALNRARQEDTVRVSNGERTLLYIDECIAEVLDACDDVLNGTFKDKIQADAPFFAAIRGATENILDQGIDVEFNNKFTRRMGDATNFGFRRNRSPFRIRLSAPLWEQAGYVQRRETIRHELGHIIANYLRPRAGHGPFWKAVAILCGSNGKRCHAVARDVNRREQFSAWCRCMEHKIGKVRYQRLKNGEMEYVCRKCKTPIHWDEAKRGQSNLPPIEDVEIEDMTFAGLESMFKMK